MTSPLLELEGVSVVFRRRREALRALDDVTLDVLPSEAVGLVGESGSGKSTIARAALGLAPIESGTVRFAGDDITYQRFKDRRATYRDMQIVFQDPFSSLNPSRTIGRTLAEPLEAFGERDPRILREAVGAMLERVRLTTAASGRYPAELSGGQRQRVAIARALMLAPKLVICDEVTSALDLSVQAQIVNLLQELQDATGVSYLFISHDLDVVRHICHRVAVLYQGRVMETSTASELARAPAHPYTSALVDAVPLPDPRAQRRRRGTGIRKAVSRLHEEGVQRCPFAPRCPHAVDRCWSERPELAPVADGTNVACHRHPAWQRESTTSPMATSQRAS